MDQQYTTRSSYGKAKSMPNVGKFRLDLLRLLRSSDSLQAIPFCYLCLNFSESNKLLSRSVYNKVTDLTGLMLSANSLPIHSLEVYCQFTAGPNHPPNGSFRLILLLFHISFPNLAKNLGLSPNLF